MNPLIVIPNQKDYFFSNYVDVLFDLEYLAVSSDSDFVPVQSVVHGEVMRGKSKCIFYGLQIPKEFERTSTYSYFYRYFNKYNYSWVRLGYKGIEKTFIITEGLLLYKNSSNKWIPLIVYAVKRQHLFNANPKNPDPYHFALVINAPEIKEVGEPRTVVQKFISTYYQKNYDTTKLDLVYSADIIRSCYNVNVEQPTFRTIQEMKDYTNNINKSFKPRT
jgi:hypothetical protein